MKTIGILPASGNASRIMGLPKFLFPVSETQTLLQWHVEQMSTVCDVIRICTRPEFIPIINNLDFDMDVEIVSKDPSTINDAINNLINEEACYIIGLPDTYSSINPYTSLYRDDLGFTLSVLDCPKDMRGKVGQVNSNGSDIEDKNSQCEYPYMWIAFSMVGTLNSNNPTPSVDFKDKIDLVRIVHKEGTFVDAGTFEGYLKLTQSLV